MRAEEIRRWVVRPVLERARLWTPAAENLVLGTGLCESGFEWLDQRDTADRPGPAFGPWQIEQSTYWSLWDREVRPQVKINCLLALGFNDPPPVEELHGNLFLGAIVCRLKYLMAPQVLPAAHDALGMAYYWKRHYNTSAGAGSFQTALPRFTTICA